MTSRKQTAWVDKWTAVHVGTGVLAGGVGLPLWIYVPASLAYEVMEQYLESNPKNIFAASGPEVIPNVVVDVLTGLAGYAAGRKWLR